MKTSDCWVFGVSHSFHVPHELDWPELGQDGRVKSSRTSRSESARLRSRGVPDWIAERQRSCHISLRDRRLSEPSFRGPIHLLCRMTRQPHDSNLRRAPVPASILPCPLDYLRPGLPSSCC